MLHRTPTPTLFPYTTLFRSLSNQYTRVFQVTVQPHATTQLHLQRHSYLFVNLGQAEIENDVQGKAPVKMKLKDGQTELAPRSEERRVGKGCRCWGSPSR